MSKRFAQAKAQIAPQPRRSTRPDASSAYSAFSQLDGRHPWQEAVPEGYVAYPVRRLERGKVVYFNFNLAREMGLISSQHDNVMTPELHGKLLETFSLQIINEYDQAHGHRFMQETLQAQPYMATRYLQLQHSNKRGKTSGDGRSIWNGFVRKGKMTWDVSSRGTGVTCLSPGAVEANKPLKTGEGTYGYGCGLADVTELVGSAVMSEIFHLKGIGTERVLTVIDLGKGCGIGVRAAPCLVRPAHLFLFLKQGRLEPLKRATDFLIDRQFANGSWDFSTQTGDRYSRMLSALTEKFAKFAARLEREYIFAWLDWDGDNVLASAGIIDYGSIRQFGLRHDQYRYDDVDRFSTSLNEQRGKARQTIQVFAQLVDFLTRGQRKAIDEFSQARAVRDFDRIFDQELRRIFLSQVGFNDPQIELLQIKHRREIENLYSSFVTLEKLKSKSGTQKLADGINRPAILNMRKALRELPELLQLHELLQSPERRPERTVKTNAMPLMASEFYALMLSPLNSKRADRKIAPKTRVLVERFLRCYLQVVKAAVDAKDVTAQIRELAERATEANRPARITGNSSEYIVDEIIKAKKRGLATAEIQSAVDLFIASQVPKSSLRHRRAKPLRLSSPAGELLQELLRLAVEFEEDI